MFFSILPEGHASVPTHVTKNAAKKETENAAATLHTVQLMAGLIPDSSTGKFSATPQHNQFTAGLSRFGPSGTPSRASYHQGVAQYNNELTFS
jgi:hypothetical protein